MKKRLVFDCLTQPNRSVLRRGCASEFGKHLRPTGAPNKSQGRPTLLAIVSLLFFVLLGLVFAPGSKAQDKKSAPAAGAAAAPANDKAAEAAKKPDELKSFDDTVKDMETIKGLFTFYRNADDNTIYMEILPEQLDKTMLFSGTIDQGTGERGIYAAQMGDSFPFVLHRAGKNIQWIQKNTSFIAAKQTPAARFTGESFTDAIIGSAKVLSKPHPERKSILIDVSEMFVSDLPGLTVALNQAYEPTNYHFDKDRSVIGGVKSFPENSLLEVNLHYVTDNPRTISITLPDVRSVPLVVKYQISTLAETGFKPRVADDRVGYFTTVQQDFTSDRPSEPYVRYVHRWQLEKADPTAKLSPPKQPIVYWLSNTIPVEYRESVRQGILLWNSAFEKIGFKDAIVVKQQPDDADWDSDDTRYSMIRWFTGVDAGFAIGPSRANPYTGQIYDAHIGFSEAMTRSVRREAEEMVGPVSAQPAAGAPLRPAAWSHNPSFECDYAEGLTQQMAFTRSVLDARGSVSPEVEDQLMREFLISVVAHEVGHTLGLRHNFRASTILKVDELYDLKKTDELSQSGSVMDYNPTVLAPKGKKQGHYLPVTLGPYDYWAIEYAYKPIDGDEKAELEKIASRSSDPMLAYDTDEDTIGTTTPYSMDPLDSQFDQSSDPIGFFRDQMSLVDELWQSEQTKLAQDGEGYQIMRRAMRRGIGEYRYALLTVTKYVGGVYHTRDHVGQPNGRTPYTPVPAAKQREALEFLRTYAFSEKAFDLPPDLLNKMAIERMPGLDFGSYFLQQLDFPWHETVLGMQSAVLDHLYNPIVLNRVEDNELRYEKTETPFTMADLFTGLNNSIWSELDANTTTISSLRRNLQRQQLTELIRLALATPPPPPPPPSPAGISLMPPPTPRAPGDATTLARASLIEIQAKIKKATAAGKFTDKTTRAHLEETQARITSTLQAQTQMRVE